MMMGGAWFIGLFVLLLFLLLLVGLVVGGAWLLRQGSGPNVRGISTTPSAREDDDVSEILRRRYAQGEINRDEYERMREDLRR